MSKIMYADTIVIILAAGQGKRMGMPKVTAVYENKIFAQYIVDTLKKISLKSLWVFSSEKMKNKVFKILDEKYPYMINSRNNADMFSSLEVASFSEILVNTENFIIWPVDFPLISENTLNLMISTANQILPSVQAIIPEYNLKKGHPVLLKRLFFTKAVSFFPQKGLKEVFHTLTPSVQTVKTNDPFILKNFNTPKDLIGK